MYEQGEGTAADGGHLYETNLISLIEFRLLNNDTIEEYHLVSNLKNIGAFDDIVFRVKITGFDRPILVFIQVKHKVDGKQLSYDVIEKCHDSLKMVKARFNARKRRSDDVLFSGNFDQIHYVFILYTNGTYQLKSNNSNVKRSISDQDRYVDKLNYLIATGRVENKGYQINYTDTDLEYVSNQVLENEIVMLAKSIAISLVHSNLMCRVFTDDYLKQYHVILAEKVVHLSEIVYEENHFGGNTEQDKWRYLTFRQDFLDTNDKVLTLLRDNIYKEVLKNLNKKKIVADQSANSNDDPTVQNKITAFLDAPSVDTLTPLLGTHIIYRTDKLKFIVDGSSQDIQRLEEISISEFNTSLTVENMNAIAARNILSKTIKVPITFGNIDLIISEHSAEIDNKLNIVTTVFEKLCKESKHNGSYEIVTIDDNIEQKYLKGICGTVGNLLIYDSATKYLMVTENPKLLKKNAKNLYYKLKDKINNLHSFRFDVKDTVTLPKLTLDFSKDAKEILNKLIIYKQQSNHDGVAEILKKDIHDLLNSSAAHDLAINTDTVYLYYHYEIHKWWTLKKKNDILTRLNNRYDLAMTNMRKSDVKELTITALHMSFRMNNINYFKCKFNDNALKRFQTLDGSAQPFSRIVVTDITTLTTVKIIQYLKHKCINNYAILDLECLLHFTNEAFTTLKYELENTEKVLIIVSSDVRDSKQISGIVNGKLNALAQVTENKNVIVITNDVTNAEHYFTYAGGILNDNKQILRDMNQESQQLILKMAFITLQGRKINLAELNMPVDFIENDVLSKIIRGELINIDITLSNDEYNKKIGVYINRQLKNIDNENEAIVVTKFEDISDRIVLIIAEAGLGKSTLLTHLSVNKTNLLVVRVNLLEHSNNFLRWQDHGTEIDILETLKFMCRVISKNDDLQIRLDENNGNVTLVDCSGDEWITFELNMFLHFYNTRKIIFLFDGVDEMCPNYKHTVIKFLNEVKRYPQEHLMWITCRPYVELLRDLKDIGKMYTISNLNRKEQAMYLRKFWQTEQFTFDGLNVVELNNLKLFIDLELDLRSDFCRLHQYRCNIINYFKYYVIIIFAFPDMNIQNIKMPSDECAVNKFLGNPLLLYLLADYIMTFVRTYDVTDNILRTINKYTIYEAFVKKKLDIKDLNKSKMDVARPDIITTREIISTQCINMHKKIAAHYILTYIFLIYNIEEFEKIRPFNNNTVCSDMIRAINSGKEKTGLIYHIERDGQPLFIHMTFAEYFAAEYVCDIIKSSEIDFNTKRLLYCALKLMRNCIMAWLQLKMDIDEEFAAIISNIHSPTFFECYEKYTFNPRLLRRCNLSIAQRLRLYSATPDEYKRFMYKYALNREMSNYKLLNIIYIMWAEFSSLYVQWKVIMSFLLITYLCIYYFGFIDRLYIFIVTIFCMMLLLLRSEFYI